MPKQAREFDCRRNAASRPPRTEPDNGGVFMPQIIERKNVFINTASWNQDAYAHPKGVGANKNTARAPLPLWEASLVFNALVGNGNKNDEEARLFALENVMILAKLRARSAEEYKEEW